MSPNLIEGRPAGITPGVRPRRTKQNRAPGLSASERLRERRSFAVGCNAR
jgi:hypothetical protein